MTFAIYSKDPTSGIVRVHYSHLTENEADREVERLNDHLRDRGIPAVYWSESHHPDCTFVIN